MKYFYNLLAIGVVAFLIWGAIQFKESSSYTTFRWHLGNFFSKTKNFIEVRKHNIKEELKPARKRPLTFIQIEAELTNWAPNALAGFTDADWAYLWELVYTPLKVSEGGYKVYRYRSRQEVQSILRDKHYSLSVLRDNDWVEFWSIAKVSWSDG
ncbi:MAG: hypothetical protein KKH93_06060 [Candidatus Omnitrophica bacterium]|nr:hypothetical protein [Candidatus Omnitrophota bacterium]MBU2043740.1 hypothetical protein [Candidatus Omnitrophota bacterium]MBU2473705.1 hypothetical protein [Candidatus Omnitrophota bacterium]